MLKNLISTQISTKEITYQPGGAPAAFEVSVVNQSEQFATFQVEVQSAGTETQSKPQWYKVSPDISSKNPPGDRTEFTIQIIDNPKPGFVGLMNLTVRIFSLELRQEERQILRLILRPSTSFVALKVNLPTTEFQAPPEDVIQIPVDVENPGYATAEVVVRCSGIPPLWLTEGNERRLQINAHSTAQTSFLCQIPAWPHAPSQPYTIAIEANRPQESAARAEACLQVLPVGSIQIDCATSQQQIPGRWGWWLPNWKARQAVYPLQLTNHSNLQQPVAIAVTPEPKQPVCQLQIAPEAVDLDIQATSQVEVIVNKQRHWFGWNRTCLFKTDVAPLAEPLAFQNQVPTLRLTLHPILPIWLQGGSLIGLLWLLAGLWFNPNTPWRGHSSSVNSVQFNGVGDRVVSGSDDQSVRSWRTEDFNHLLRNPHLGKMAANIGKAVRVVRYRPVNNDVIAIGLENGEIQLWSVLAGENRPLQSFTNQPDDRVFDLVFPSDSRSLFSGHGSGAIVQWSLPPNVGGATPPTLQRQKNVGFAVTSLGLVGDTENYLAIAGRFNQLVLWDLKQDTLYSLNTRSGSEADYILSLGTAAQKPLLLASADNRGTIKIWNLQTCLSDLTTCQPIDEWTPDKIVRSVAFSPDGCYLASAGGDGRTVLWGLDSEGRRAGQKLDGWTLERLPTSINSVDVVQKKNEILVVSGDDAHRVHLYRVKQENVGCR